MSKQQQVDITPAMALEFLATTIKEMREAGLSVAVKNVPAKGDREAGLILFVGRTHLIEGEFVPLGEGERVAQTAVPVV